MIDPRILEMPKIKEKIESYMKNREEVERLEEERGKSAYVRARWHSLGVEAMELAGLLVEAEIELLKTQGGKNEKQ